MRPQLKIHFPGPYDGWIPVDREDSIAAELADRHYSRQTPGADGYMPPGKCVAFVHVGIRGLAVWGAVLNLDPIGTVRWRNTIFRNESSTLSSSLIEMATAATYGEWTKKYKTLPDVPFETEIDIAATARRRSRWVEPGHCYRMAGWREVRRTPPPYTVDRRRSCSRRRGDRVTLRRVLRAPFPWFGGKFNAAPLIWAAFGNVPNYVEPFAGSLATLLARPHEAKVETVNDKDGLIANFWRAVQHAPDDVAKFSDWPVNEADLHARHRWLVDQALPLTEKLIADPDWFDAKVAGWWVWGVCAWIGGGWCHPDVRLQRRRPELANVNGRGVNHPDRRRPHLSSAGMGVLSLPRSLPLVGSPGNGVHAPGKKKPLTHRNKGVHRDGAPEDLFEQLATRLRNVRVCCGDWTRVIGRSTLGIDTRHGMTPCGVILDPPYAHELRDKRMYREDDEGLSAVVRAWALENGSNSDLRIALCGFVDEHDMPNDWRCHEWRSTSSGKNRSKERIWFSPHCLEVDPRQAVLPLEYSA